jgi:hypothetical protein
MLRRFVANPSHSTVFGLIPGNSATSLIHCHPAQPTGQNERADRISGQPFSVQVVRYLAFFAAAL